MRNKREHLARLGTRLGAVRLLERSAAAARPGLFAFTYHRIADPGGGDYYAPVVSAAPEMFRRQIETLKRHVHIVALDEWIELAGNLPGGDRFEKGDRHLGVPQSQSPFSKRGPVERGRRSREPAALLTFDDGYRDNFETAAPILKELNVPATFFLPTGFLESPGLPWWDEVAYIIKHHRDDGRGLSPSPGPLPEGPLSIDEHHSGPDATIKSIIGAFLKGEIADERAYLDELAEQAEVRVDREALGRALFAGWELVRSAIDDCPLFSIGSHGHTHRKLAGLSEAEQRFELFESKRVLEERLGRPIDALAYPYGWPGAFGETARALAREAGYRVAFSAVEGVNRPGAAAFDRFALRRINVGSGDSPALLRARAALLGAFGRSPL